MYEGDVPLFTVDRLPTFRPRTYDGKVVASISKQWLPAACQPPNKQLQRTVIRRRGRGACASFHYAHAPRWTRAARRR